MITSLSTTMMMRMPKPKSKVKKRYVAMCFLAMFGMFCLASAPTFAANYNLQPYTTCVNGLCSTSLDVSTLGLSANKITALKAVNITNFLTKSGVINNFKYSWNGNIVTITGTVNNNVYWSFGAGGDTFDPWWNVSTTGNKNSTWIAPFAYEGNAANDAGKYYGYSITVNSSNYCLFSTKKNAGDNAVSVDVYKYSDHSFVGRANYSGVYTNFSLPLTSGIRYDLVEISDNRYYHAGTSYPYLSNAFNVTSMFEYNSGTSAWDYSLTTYGVNYIEIILMNCSQTNTFYTNTLFLNGTASNLTMANSTALNMTGITNLTDAYVSIWLNGTLSANSTNSATNITNLSIGYYNVTAFFGNTSTNETLTLWANMTLPPIPPIATVNYSYVICSTNSTLLTHDAKFYNGTFNYTDTYTLCRDGCENVTGSCKAAPFYSNLYTLIVLIIILAIIYWVIK